jgi:hypothetical protein
MFFHKSHVMLFVFCWCKDMDIFPQMHNTGNIVIHSVLFVHLSFATLSYCYSYSCENGRVSRSNSGDLGYFMPEGQFFAGIGPAHFPAARHGY